MLGEMIFWNVFGEFGQSKGPCASKGLHMIQGGTSTLVASCARVMGEGELVEAEVFLFQAHIGVRGPEIGY